MTHISVIDESNTYQFARSIEHFLSNGWQLQGSMVVIEGRSGVRFCQMMVKDTPKHTTDDELEYER